MYAFSWFAKPVRLGWPGSTYEKVTTGEEERAGDTRKGGNLPTK
jgi:hypothetical protein